MKKTKKDQAYLKTCEDILPGKCDCGKVLKDKNFKVLRYDAWLLYLVIICDCDWIITIGYEL